MASVNKAILVGHLGADPEVRYTQNGDAIANLRLATTDRYKDKATGEQKETTEWHRISLFGRVAEVANEYLKKGSMVYIEGRIRTRKWQGQDGQDRYTTEIVGHELKMLGRPASEGQRGEQDDSGSGALPASNRPANARQPSETRPPAGASTARPQAQQPTRGAAPARGADNQDGYGGYGGDGGFDQMDDDIPF